MQTRHQYETSQTQQPTTAAPAPSRKHPAGEFQANASPAPAPAPNGAGDRTTDAGNTAGTAPPRRPPIPPAAAAAAQGHFAEMTGATPLLTPAFISTEPGNERTARAGAAGSANGGQSVRNSVGGRGQVPPADLTTSDPAAPALVHPVHGVVHTAAQRLPTVPAADDLSARDVFRTAFSMYRRTGELEAVPLDVFWAVFGAAAGDCDPLVYSVSTRLYLRRRGRPVQL